MSNSTPQPYIQMFSTYDKAFVTKVHSLINYSQDASGNDISYQLPCVFATPERAFAQIKKQIARKKGVKVEQIQTIPLPIASLSRVEQKLDPTRYVKDTMRRMYYEPMSQTYVGVNRPTPWDMTYQIDIWARTIADMDSLTTQIVQWIRGNEFYLRVDHPFPILGRIVLTELIGMTETPWQDTKSEEERTLRRTFTFVVHGWICHAPAEASIIKKIVTSLYDDTNELSPIFLESVTVTGTNPNFNEPATPIIPPEGPVSSIVTTLFAVLIVGEAEDGQSYGNFVLPAAATITGMQAAVLGRGPTGSDLILRMKVNGVSDPVRSITVSDGTKKTAGIFAIPITLPAGSVLSVYCEGVGSTLPGDWIEIRWDAQIVVTTV